MTAKDQRQSWLAKLNVGDAVIVANYYNERVDEVEKITPSGRITVSHTVYRPDGCEYGDSRSFHPYCLREATPEAIEAIRQKEIASKALSLMRDCRKVSYEQAVRIIEVLGGDSD